MRGYDSIILKQYAEYMSVIEAQNETQFNRIAAADARMAASIRRMLDLLNVKYVLTDPEVPIESPKYKLVYDAEVKVYENLGVLPRAFTMPIGCETVTDDPLAALKQHDPRTTVIVEKPADRSGAANPACALHSRRRSSIIRINDVVIKANAASAQLAGVERYVLHRLAGL